MNEMGLGTQILLLLVILHFVVGFGYVMYKLSPRKGDKKDNASDKNQEK